jgi:hypothetical protein
MFIFTKYRPSQIKGHLLFNLQLKKTVDKNAINYFTSRFPALFIRSSFFIGDDISSENNIDSEETISVADADWRGEGVRL